MTGEAPHYTVHPGGELFRLTREQVRKHNIKEGDWFSAFAPKPTEEEKKAIPKLCWLYEYKNPGIL